MHRKLEMLGISPKREASLTPGSGLGGTRRQELEGIFGGAESGGVCLGIRNEGDESYRRTFSVFVRTFVFRGRIMTKTYPLLSQQTHFPTSPDRYFRLRLSPCLRLAPHH